MKGEQPMPCPKPEPLARTKRRRQRQEVAIVKDVRAQCVARDGYCATWSTGAVSSVCGPCSGRSEWAHFGAHTRAKTRGMAPERRHTTAGSFMLCARHHRDYDAHRLLIVALSDRGCDGPLVFSAEDRRQEERP